MGKRRATGGDGGARRPGTAGRAAAVALLAALALAPANEAWEPARIEPRVDNMEELLAGCEDRRARVLELNARIDAWVEHHRARGEDISDQVEKRAVPTCSAGEIVERLSSRQAGVWGMVSTGSTGLLFATVNLPLSGLIVSYDGGQSWHYRHLFVRGYNIDRTVMLRGLDQRRGRLAVATGDGLLLSADGGRSFEVVLGGRSLSTVAFSPRAEGLVVAAGDGTSFLSTDGGLTWHDLDLTGFVGRLETENRHRTDHVVSLAFDPGDRLVYAGTGSHLYRYALAPAPGSPGRWQAMEGARGRPGRVHDDSTVYNIEIGSRLMISTCNGVYYLERSSPDLSRDQADVVWGKFRDRLFHRPSLDGPKGNLRSYFVTEDPDEPGRVLVADYAGLYEGRIDGSGAAWRRIEELPFHSPAAGYPEYTAIAWTSRGDAVVGSRYRGIFVQSSGRERGGSGPSCLLR